MFHTLISRISQNWKSGLTVALVSIPLSLSLAIASGAAPMTGIITAVWAGLVAAIFGGSHFNVIGPAGALSGILAAYTLMNDPKTLPVLAILSGVLILIAWLGRLERFLVFVPGSTIHGFTLSVGITIAFTQLNSALGLSGLEKHPEFLQNVAESFRHLSQASLPTFVTFAVGLGFLFLLLKLKPKLPGAIVLAPLAILLGYLSSSGYFSFQLATIGSTFPDIKASLIDFPVFVLNKGMVITAFTVAFVAILETMLSAKIADGMTKTVYNERKEMFGLGLANVVSGFFGGLPATGVLVRTALNARSGANHKVSSAINAIIVGIVSLVLFQWFKFLPMAAIAAILVFASIRMVEFERFAHYFRHDRVHFFLALLVTAVSVYKDPTIGLLVGIVVSLFVFMEKVSRGQCEIIENRLEGGEGVILENKGLKQFEAQDKRDHILVYSLKGPLAYINSQAHISRFRSHLVGYDWVILRLREVNFMDSDGVDALDSIIEMIEDQGKKVCISGLNVFTQQSLDHLSAFQRLQKEGFVFGKTKQALEYVRGISEDSKAKN